MADFCRGFVFERDVTAPLTIEGLEVKGFKETADGASGYLPSGELITAPSVEKLVECYVARTGALKRREDVRTEHLRELHKGKEAWNQWRRDHQIQPMLAGVDKSRDLAGCQLEGYDFSYANLCEAQLRGVHLEGANFHQAILAGADLSDAHLEGANFCRTDLYKTIFRNAKLKGANLQGVQLAKTDLTGADLRDCKVYGMSAWDLELAGTQQENLIIRYTPVAEHTGQEVEVVVDGLDLAAFMYFTLNNRNIARIIEVANRKWVLILGRFTERKNVLEAVAKALKQEQFIPIIFDFGRPEQRDLIETIILLAGMSAFVIAEITHPQSTPLELQAIASNYGVPIFPVIQDRARPFGMFSGLRKFRWVFPPLTYKSTDDLIAQLPDKVITPAREEARRLAEWKRLADTSS
jgi:hypothetical protein